MLCATAGTPLGAVTRGKAAACLALCKVTPRPGTRATAVLPLRPKKALPGDAGMRGHGDSTHCHSLSGLSHLLSSFLEVENKGGTE